MSTDVAIKLETIQSIRKMKEDDAGGGNVGGRNEFKKLKRKSDESIEIGGKKLKKKWNTIRRKKSNRGKKFQRMPKSPLENGGETPKSAESKKKVTTTTTTTTAPSAGGKRKRRMTESFNAPFNSTQFLMNDHKTEAVRHLDSTLNGGRGEGQTDVDDENSVDISMAERPQRRITRARESSFSIDSDEDYYYSSPEDEEEFMSREFIKDYDNLRNDRLIDMSKSELINEYLQMEERIEALEKRLSRQNSTSQTTAENDTKLEEEQENTSDSNSKEAMADTISKFQKEIQRLESENDKLKLVQAVPPIIPQQHIPPGCSSSCSSCSESGSESDSDSDSDDSSESEDDSEMEEEKETKQVFDTILREKSRQIGEVEGDTGYESGHSNKPVTKNATISNLINNDEGIATNDTTEDKPPAENTNEIESEPESCPELISVNCITSTSP